MNCLQSVGTGSGLFGSVTAADLSRATAGSPAGAPAGTAPAAAAPSGSFTDIPLSSMRNVIAKRLLLSKQVSQLKLFSFIYFSPEDS